MTKEHKEDYMIRILSTVEDGDGKPEKMDLATRGRFQHRGSSSYIVYKETETTGYAGCTTTLKIADDGSSVTMLRFGDKASAQMRIEKGRRSICHYETGYGSVTLGITGDEIINELNEKGGRVRFSYLLDADCTEISSRNTLDVTVRHLN